MHFSLLSLVMSVAVLTASGAVWCRCWLAGRHRERQRRRRQREWDRLTIALRDVDRNLDRVWAAEAARSGWSRGGWPR